MASITNDLLKEAIADAERVRETAIANAKIQLEESIAPAIKDEITKALTEAHDPHKAADAHGYAEVGESVETEGEAVEEIANDATSGIAASDNKEPSPASSKSSGVGASGESGNGEGETPQLMPEEEQVDEDVEEVNEGILDLEAIIRELQAEVEELAGGALDEEDDELDVDIDDEEDWEDGEDLDLGDDSDDEPELDMGDEEDEEDDLDIEEILREIEAELSEEEDVQEAQVAEENARLQSELSQYREAVEILRGKLNEVNLLNAKLLFTNKLFKNRELTKEQKVHVVETFDLATTLREVKLLYATLSEATIPGKTAKKQGSTQQIVTESIASGVVGSTAPTKEVITEDTGADFRKRMQELAGVKVL
tara:strand:- start:1596 stop:2699 length:1104 start_codon:yes stop_codon:yes gene_type:complete